MRSIPASITSYNETYAPLGARLLHASSAEWEGEASALLPHLEAFLPSPSLLLSVATYELTVEWASGPSPVQVKALLTKLLGEEAHSDTEGIFLSWRGLEVSLRRASLPAARGFALLSAALGGLCPVCEEDFGAFEAAGFAALDRPDPQLLSSHPNLAALSVLGADLSLLERLAEVVGGLCEDGSDTLSGEFFHERGHLPGLVALAEDLAAL